MALRIRRKSFDDIRRQAARTVSRLSGGYAQPVDYINGRLSVDNEIYDSAKARRNRQRIERVVSTANRYQDNIAKVNGKVDEPYINSKQYEDVSNAKLTKYPMMTYANITPNAMRRPQQSANTKSKGNVGG